MLRSIHVTKVQHLQRVSREHWSSPVLSRSHNSESLWNEVQSFGFRSMLYYFKGCRCSISTLLRHEKARIGCSAFCALLVQPPPCAAGKYVPPGTVGTYVSTATYRLRISHVLLYVGLLSYSSTGDDSHTPKSDIDPVPPMTRVSRSSFETLIYF
jgi:hypothetical protein